jgi:hypothetical protein
VAGLASGFMMIERHARGRDEGSSGGGRRRISVAKSATLRRLLAPPIRRGGAVAIVKCEVFVSPFAEGSTRRSSSVRGDDTPQVIPLAKKSGSATTTD